MIVTIRTGSWARQFMPQEETKLTLCEGAVVADALEALPIPSDEIGPAVINGCVTSKGAILHEGDMLEVLPMLIGG